MTQKMLYESSATLVAEGDTYKAVLITPGMGSSGYYDEAMLREHIDAFPAGTHSYVNHLSEGEHRSPEKLLGVTTENAYYEDGVGIVARIKPMSHFREFVKEVAPYTGLSISAEGRGSMQEMDGQQVFVVEALVPNIQNTVDLVSYAGRGGKFAESLVEQAIATQSSHTESSDGTDKKDTHMATLEEQVADLSTKFVTFVSAQEAAVAAGKSEAVTVSEAVSKAVDATAAVEASDAPESFKESLRAEIKAGNYDVSAKLAAVEALRKEILDEAEANGSTSSTSAVVTEDLDVKGW